MSLTTVPFPELTTRTYNLAGSMSINPVLGQFILSPTDFVDLLQICRGTMYRFLSVSFSANCDEVDFRNAFVAVGSYSEPMARLVYLPENFSITPKPFPIRNFYQDISIHSIFVPTSTTQQLAISFAGTFNGDKIPGISPLVLSYSVTMQELADETFQTAVRERKF